MCARTTPGFRSDAKTHFMGRCKVPGSTQCCLSLRLFRRKIWLGLTPATVPELLKVHYAESKVFPVENIARVMARIPSTVEKDTRQVLFL